MLAVSREGVYVTVSADLGKLVNKDDLSPGFLPSDEPCALSHRFSSLRYHQQKQANLVDDRLRLKSLAIRLDSAPVPYKASCC